MQLEYGIAFSRFLAAAFNLCVGMLSCLHQGAHADLYDIMDLAAMVSFAS